MFNCTNQYKVRNPYTGQEVIANCGKCDYCLSMKSADYASRIKQEFLNGGDVSRCFVTLTYDNEHLPVYCKADDGYWHSSEFRQSETGKNLYERFRAIPNDDITEYVVPVKYKRKQGVFGHLCYPHLHDFIGRVREKFFRHFAKYCNKKFKEKRELLFPHLSKDDFTFRYIGCGEYGPTSFRPHYHIIVWFKRRFTDEQWRYVWQIISSCWSFGAVDIQDANDDGLSGYLSSYVAGFADLPKTYHSKSVRPFVVFSKNPIIGYISIPKEEVQEVLNTSTFSRTKWDDKTSEYIDVKLPDSVYRRNFPKCTGFSSRDFASKLSVYSYVFNHFKDQGIQHTEQEVNALRLCDIPFPKRRVLTELDLSLWRDKNGCSIYEDPASIVLERKRWKGEKASQYPKWLVRDWMFGRKPHYYETLYNSFDYKEWDYKDKYAALVCYRYCVIYNTTPEDVLNSIERIYSKRKLHKLKEFYEYQQEQAELHNTAYTLSHDMFFIDELPKYADLLEDWQLSVLYSYGVDVDRLYNPERGFQIDNGFRSDLKFNPLVMCHISKYHSSRIGGIKSKKLNDYKENLEKGNKLIHINNQSCNYGK